MVNHCVELGMAIKQQKSKSPIREKRPALGREAWLEAARQALIAEGTAGVEINKLAKRLGVTRGGCYWYFKNRQQLLDALLSFWAESSTGLFERVIDSAQRNGLKEFYALTDLLVDEKEYDPKWDGAVRDWARTSAVVLKTVQIVDVKRIAIIEKMFLNMGYKGKHAQVRARVMYYHQVGYYALGVRETRKQRLALLPYYAKVLTGLDAD
jgi:AcrR family transcriptional regulator